MCARTCMMAQEILDKPNSIHYHTSPVYTCALCVRALGACVSARTLGMFGCGCAHVATGTGVEEHAWSAIQQRGKEQQGNPHYCCAYANGVRRPCGSLVMQLPTRCSFWNGLQFSALGHMSPRQPSFEALLVLHTRRPPALHSP